jgi:NADPH-dependent ferric siderophore reductase
MASNTNTLARHISVHSVEQLSPHLQRVYFASDDFADFPQNSGGGHIKLFFPETSQLTPPLPIRNETGKVVWPNGVKPLTRTYTVRDFDQNNQLLVIDFVRHEDFGVAADWAIHAQAGQKLGLAGPGGPERFNAHAEYWIFIGDLSSVPMIAASLEQLPSDAIGKVWIEIDDPKDQIQLSKPEHIDIEWLINDKEFENKIFESFKNLDWSKQNISVSLAGENGRVVSIRKVLRNEYKIEKRNLYAVPYWKVGHNEESYHEERHHVMDDEG